MDEDPSSRLTVQVDDPAWHGLVDDVEGCCRRAIGAALDAINPPPWIRAAPIDLLLTNDARIRALNAAWRGRDAPTDVLSFPGLELDPDRLPDAAPVPPAPLGDLVLASGTVRRDAEEDGKTPADHLSHLVVHGFLHLLGHDHGDEPRASRMEDQERRILARLGIADPYPATEAVG